MKAWGSSAELSDTVADHSAPPSVYTEYCKQTQEIKKIKKFKVSDDFIFSFMPKKDKTTAADSVTENYSHLHCLIKYVEGLDLGLQFSYDDCVDGIISKVKNSSQVMDVQ